MKTKILISLLAFLVASCASITQQRRFDKYHELLSAGDYLAAAEFELKEKSATKNNPADLLIVLQAAASLRYAKQYTASSALFDEAEEIIKRHNEALLLQNVGSQAAAILVNDAVMDYQANEYDGVMINTYKGLNFWQQGKIDLARVEFNRALTRQQRAKIRFAREIKQQQDAIAKQQAKQAGANIDANLNNPGLARSIASNYPNLKKFKAYPSFINPFTTYIAGLFFGSEGDYQKSATLLKEAYAMVDNHATVSDDFAVAESLANGERSDGYYTWVIFENGLGPIKEEFRIDLPLLLLTNKVKYTGIALPKLKLRNLAYDSLTIKTPSNTVKTSTLASMDRIIQTEFASRFPAIVSRAVVSTAVKTAAQYIAREATEQAVGYGYGEIAGLATGLYQAATTAADIRSWTALPKAFHLAKIAAPKTGWVSIRAKSAKPVQVKVPQQQNSLIYIKSAVKGTSWVYDVIKM